MKSAKRILICALALSIALMAGCNMKKRTDEESGASSGESPPVSEAAVWETSEDFGTPLRSEKTSKAEPQESQEPHEDESEGVAVASGDFSELAGLSTELVEWGSGGPTDDSGRPNGAIAYQKKYGQYNAWFYLPESEKMYLTFDEGYEYGYTPAILDTLRDKNVKAVFFITMHFAKSQPELVRRMIDEGHTVGNHSSDHKAYPSLPVAEASKDMMELHDYVKENFGYEMSLFRFPEGKFSEQCLAMVQSNGYKSLFWSFAYVDYYVDRQPLTIDALDKIVSKGHPGALYLLHAVSRTNTEVLGEAIDLLREQGYEFAAWDI